MPTHDDFQNGTVKQILQLMEKNADERHERTQADLRQLTLAVNDVQRRVGDLEKDKNVRDGANSERSAIGTRVNVVLVTVAMLVSAVSAIPAFLFYIRGGHG